MQIDFHRTRLRLDFSFALVTTLMLIFFDERIVLISVVSSLLHEFGHLFMMKLCKEKIEKVVFGAFGVRIEKYAFSGISYKKEIVIALSGILVNLVLFFIGSAVYCETRSETAFTLAAVNLFIALMNSLPLGSLDMGKAVNYALLMHISEERSQRICRIISSVFCALFIVFTFFYCILVKVNFSLIAVCIYLLSETELKING